MLGVIVPRCYLLLKIVWRALAPAAEYLTSFSELIFSILNWYFFVSHIHIRDDNQCIIKCLVFSLFRIYVLRIFVLQCRVRGIAGHATGLKSPSANGMAEMVSISVMIRIKDYCTSIQMALHTHRGENWQMR